MKLRPWRPSVFSQGPPERTCLEHGNGIVFALSGARDSLRAPAACPRAYTLHALSFASVMPSCGIVGHRGHLFSSLIHSLYSFSLSARLDFHTTPFFPTPFSSHPTLHAFTYRWIFSPPPPNSREATDRTKSRSRDGYTRENESHGSRTRPSVGEPAHSTEFPDNRAFRAAVRSPPILRARLTVSTVTLKPRLTSFCDPHGIDDGYHEPTDVADRFPQMSSSVPVSVVTGLSDAPSPATNAELILIWLQRRAVSPPRLSLALALCVAYRHWCPSSRFNRGRSSHSRLLSLSGQRSLSLSTLSLSLSSSFSLTLPPSSSGPHPRIVGWHGIPCGTIPFRRSLVGSFPLRPAAIVHANIAGEERIVTMARSIW